MENMWYSKRMAGFTQAQLKAIKKLLEDGKSVRSFYKNFADTRYLFNSRLIESGMKIVSQGSTLVPIEANKKAATKSD